MFEGRRKVAALRLWMVPEMKRQFRFLYLFDRPCERLDWQRGESFLSRWSVKGSLCAWRVYL